MKSISIGIVMVLSLALYGCGQSNHTAENEHKEPASVHDSDEIIFTSEQAQSVGLTVEKVAKRPFSQVIKASGQVLAALGDEETVVATSNGVVDDVSLLSEGKAVRQGETLMTISARNMVAGDPVTKARIEYETAQKEYERAELLVKDKIIAVREYEQIRLRYEMAQSAYEGVASYGEGKGVKVISPQKGFVKSRLVEQGDYVTVGQPVAVIAQNRRLQLRAEVSERYFNQLQGVQSANFKLPYDYQNVQKLSDLNGLLLSFGKTSAQNSFYLPVTFEFDNVGHVIPGSYAEIYLLGMVRQQVISIPESALTEAQGVYYVYIQLDDEGYKRQEVTIGQNDGERVEILSGLNVGDRVVTRGALQIRLAAHSSEVPEAHNH